MKFINKKSFYTILGIFLIFVLWYVVSEIVGEKKLIFPGPLETFKYLLDLLQLKSTYLSILNSFYKMLLGYMMSIVLALVFGIISGISEKVENLLLPLMSCLKAIPTASVLFLFIVLSGFDYAPIYVVFLISFPILYESFVGGIKNIPTNIQDSLKLDGGNSLKCVFEGKLPLAMNYILVGIASSFALAFKIEIMSEVLSGSTHYGIGNSIKTLQATQTDMTGIFAWSLIAIIFVLLITFITKSIKKFLTKHLNG